MTTYQIEKAATAACDALFYFAIESGEHLTCTEIETLVALYRILGRDVEADEILSADASHATSDEEGDEHYVEAA